jgi:hypothetical protein
MALTKDDLLRMYHEIVLIRLVPRTLERTLRS